MNSQFKYLGIIVLISFIFNSCNKEKDEELPIYVYVDSIQYYNKKIKTATLSDSIKLNFVKKTFLLNEKLPIDSVRIKNNDTIAFNFFKLNDERNYILVTKINLEDAIKYKDTNRISKIYRNLGYFYYEKNVLDSAFYNFDKAQKLYEKLKQVDKTNEMSVNKASIQFYANDYLGCEETVFKSLFSIKRQNDDLNLNIAYSLIGLSKIELAEYEEANEYLNLSLEISKNINNSSSVVGIAYNNLGLLNYKMKDYQKAIEYYSKTLNIKNFKSIDNQTYTFAKQYLLLSKFKIGEINNFEYEFKKNIENYKKLNLSTIQPKIQLSEFYESQNNIKKAKVFALEAYYISIKEKAFRDKLLALKQLANVFPEKAKFYSNEYIKLSDSIAAVDKKTQNTFARIEYRVDELSNENEILAERNKRIIYYAVIGLLLLSLYYFYNWQKQKQRELLLVQEQQKANEQVYSLLINQQTQMDEIKAQEQKRISQELHDGVLGKLFGARMNLDFINSQQSEEIKKEKQKYIHEIIEVERQIRQISHELNDDKRAIISNFQLLLDKFVEEQETLLGFKIEYLIANKIPWDVISAEEKINLYRIIQESFQNIIKYAKAKSVTFSLNCENNKLKISILDDGIGFDLKRASKGIGIKNMKDRAMLIKADFNIESEPFKGTRTQIKLEINPNKEI